eukprot:4364098-Pyramimonas_sp.AAC.1
MSPRFRRWTTPPPSHAGMAQARRIALEAIPDAANHPRWRRNVARTAASSFRNCDEAVGWGSKAFDLKNVDANGLKDSLASSSGPT